MARIKHAPPPLDQIVIRYRRLDTISAARRLATLVRLSDIPDRGLLADRIEKRAHEHQSAASGAA